MNNQLSVNIFLTEKFLGKCWHEENRKFHIHNNKTKCIKCNTWQPIISGVNYGAQNLNLFTPNGFFLLWEKAQKEEWWDKFYYEFLTIAIELDWRFSYQKFNIEVINPLTFPTLLATYLGWKE